MADKTAESLRDQRGSIVRQESGFTVWEQRPQSGDSAVPTSSTPRRRDSDHGQKRRHDVTRNDTHTKTNTCRPRKVLKCSTPIRNTRVNEHGTSLLRIKTTLGKSGNKRRTERRAEHANIAVGENTQVYDSRVKACRDLSTTMYYTTSGSLLSDSSRREPLQSLDNCFVLRSEEDSIASGVSFIYTGHKEAVSLTTEDSTATRLSIETSNTASMTTDRQATNVCLLRTTFVKPESRTCPDLLGEDEERTVVDSTVDFLAHVYKGSLLQTHDSMVKDDQQTVRWC